MTKNEEIPAFNDTEIKHHFLEVSTMNVAIPTYRNTYITENFKSIAEKLTQKKLHLDHTNNILTVSTTKQTRDPYILIKAQDYINLIVRGVAYETAEKVLEDKYTCEIIKTSTNLAKDTFINRRARLEGPNGSTLKAIKLITKTDIIIQGKTVCIIGEFKRVREAIEIVSGCYKNLHPVYMIKKLMVRRELEKDKEMVDVDWKRYLPDVKSKMKNQRGDGKKKKSEKKVAEEDIADDDIAEAKIAEENENKENMQNNNAEETKSDTKTKTIIEKDKKTKSHKIKKSKKIYEAPDE
ncbi:ribosomal RNA assembly protein krr1 [Conglomerata obtusa]